MYVLLCFLCCYWVFSILNCITCQLDWVCLTSVIFIIVFLFPSYKVYYLCVCQKSVKPFTNVHPIFYYYFYLSFCEEKWLRKRREVGRIVGVIKFMQIIETFHLVFNFLGTFGAEGRSHDLNHYMPKGYIRMVNSDYKVRKLTAIWR